MLRKNRTTLTAIGAALALLCLVSLYRQLSLLFMPLDPARPVIVYFVYLLLLAGWWASVSVRITQRHMRRFLLAEHAAMLLWMTVRFAQDAVLYRNIHLMRMSGYLIAIPLILIPLLGLFASFGLSQSEEYGMNKKWYFLLPPAACLVLLMLTNENHHFIFGQRSGDAQWNLYFHPNIGLAVIALWSLALELARILLIFRRSRQTAGHVRLKMLPFFIAGGIVLFSIPYLLSSFVVGYELVEYSAAIFFLEALVWESCMFVGMVPVNTQYAAVFDRSTVAMQIVDQQGQSYLKSACAPAVPAAIFTRLQQESSLRTAAGQELHLHPISGGYAVWQNDISQTLAVIKELERSREKLEYEGELLRQELKARSDGAAVKEQNRIYSRLTREVGDRLLLLQKLLDTREQVQDKDALFWQICLIGTYMKRRCNLRLIEQTDGRITNHELALCYEDLLGCLRQMGVEARVQWHTSDVPASEFAIFSVDLLQFLLEQEQFQLQSICIVFETARLFSVQIRQFGQSTPVPAEKIQQMNHMRFETHVQSLPHGYQILVSEGGG